MHRYELTDAAWERLRGLLPPNGRRGGQWRDHRTLVNGMFWVLMSGAPWRDLPERYGPWKSVYGRYRRWARDGTLQAMLDRLHLRLDEQGRIDWSQFDIDGASVRADRSAAGAGKKGAAASRPTTRWAAAGAVGAASSTW